MTACHKYGRGRCNDPACQYVHVTSEQTPEVSLNLLEQTSGVSQPTAAAHGRHGVALISAGWKNNGGNFLKDWMPSVKWNELWHRVDLVFNAREHLDWRGTDTRAHAQFARLYPDFEQYFAALEPYIVQCTFDAATAHTFICKSGHHRSVCFVELLGLWLAKRHPRLWIWKWHLDHDWKLQWNQDGKICTEVCNLEYFQRLRETEQEERLEVPVINAAKAGRARPVLLLHRL